MTTLSAPRRSHYYVLFGNRVRVITFERDGGPTFIWMEFVVETTENISQPHGQPAQDPLRERVLQLEADYNHLWLALGEDDKTVNLLEVRVEYEKGQWEQLERSLQELKQRFLGLAERTNQLARSS